MSDHATGQVEEVYLPTATAETRQALKDTAAERVRQVRKWGVQTRPDGTGPQYLAMAEAAKARTDARADDGTLEWLDILMEEVAEAAAESDHPALREELIQVAAVALSWVEDIDRKAGASQAALDRLRRVFAVDAAGEVTP